jgi:lantibiotic modifying enzyme
MRWRPLLEGSLAAQAREAVEEVAAAVTAPAAWIPESLTDTTRVTWRAGIAAGAAGKALFFTYLALDRESGTAAGAAGGMADPSETALTLLDQASEALAEVPMGEGLFTGFPGIAWANDHLRGRLYESEGDDANREIDEALIELLSHPRPRAEYDLINGLVGIGAYALEGLPRPTAARCLELAVERLADKAEHGPDGIAWFSPPEALSPYQTEVYTKGLYNLGASHGMPGIVAVLGGACRAGVAEERARPLLEGAVAWLLRRRQPADADFCFPHFYHPEVESAMCRTAWCYGDPGVAATLLAAARGAGVAAWEEPAMEAALSAAARAEDKSRIRDAGLCHGAAGIAHLFNRMYQATGEEKLAEAARFWYGWTLRFRQPGQGVAGFRSWSTDGEGNEDWRSDPGFLEGAAGIGLSLLAAISPVEPEWDRLLLAGGRLDRREPS